MTIRTCQNLQAGKGREMNDDSLNERAARKARMEESVAKDSGSQIGVVKLEDRIDANMIYGYLLGRQHEKQLAGIAKPLPSKCPECGADNPWHIAYYADLNIGGHVCKYCNYAAELFQDTESGRRKFLPVE